MPHAITAPRPVAERHARHATRAAVPPAQGLEWVALNHETPAVVHMSVEGAYSSVVNRAVDSLIRNHNMHVVVSAGAGREAGLQGALPGRQGL